MTITYRNQLLVLPSPTELDLVDDNHDPGGEGGVDNPVLLAGNLTVLLCRVSFWTVSPPQFQARAYLGAKDLLMNCRRIRSKTVRTRVLNLVYLGSKFHIHKLVKKLKKRYIDFRPKTTNLAPVDSIIQQISAKSDKIVIKTPKQWIQYNFNIYCIFYLWKLW